jgi:hypothetical protein
LKIIIWVRNMEEKYGREIWKRNMGEMNEGEE